MDGCGGYLKGLGTGAAILLGQVVVTNMNINGSPVVLISSMNNTERKNNN